MSPFNVFEAIQNVGYRFPEWLNRQVHQWWNDQLDQFANSNTSQAGSVIAQLAISPPNPSLQKVATEILKQVTGQEMINGICSTWEETRHSYLEALILEMGWLATNPAKLKVLTTLKAGNITPFETREIKLVIEALGDRDPEIKARAEEALRSLEGNKLDTLADIWSKQRQPLLLEILIAREHVPKKPAAARTLVALKLERWEVISNSTPAMIPPLVEALKDEDPEISERAAKGLRLLKKPGAQEELCNLVIEKDLPEAEAAALEAGYLPTETYRKALFYFVTGQWEKYEALDFDHRLLRGAYEAGDAAFRRRLAGKVRASGRTEYLTAIAGGDYRARAGQVTGEEAEVLVQILSANREWERLWPLVFEIPLAWSLEAVKRLVAGGWQPSRVDEREIFGQLKEQAAQAGEITGLFDRNYLPPAIMRALTRVPGRVNDVAFSPSGSHIAIGTGTGKVVLWNMREGRREHLLKGFEHSVAQLTFTPGGMLLCAERGNTWDGICGIYGWDGENGFRLGEHAGQVTGLEALGTGQAISSGRDGRTVLWDLAERRAVAEYHEPFGNYWPRSICLSPSGDKIALMTRGAKVLSLPELNETGRVAVRVFNVARSAAFAPDSETLVVGANSKELKCIKIGQGKAREVPGFPEGKFGIAHVLATLPGQPVMIWGNPQGYLEFIRWPSGEKLGWVRVPGERLTSLKISPDGTFMVAGNADTSFTLWDLRGQELQRIFPQPLARATVNHLATVEMVIESSAELKLPLRFIAALRFMELVLKHRFRYDVELAEVPSIRAGEFDIEIEG